MFPIDDGDNDQKTSRASIIGAASTSAALPRGGRSGVARMSPKSRGSGKGEPPKVRISFYVFNSRAIDGRTLLPAALAFVSFGFVLARVRI